MTSACQKDTLVSTYPKINSWSFSPNKFFPPYVSFLPLSHCASQKCGLFLTPLFLSSLFIHYSVPNVIAFWSLYKKYLTEKLFSLDNQVCLSWRNSFWPEVERIIFLIWVEEWGWRKVSLENWTVALSNMHSWGEKGTPMWLQQREQEKV